MAERAASWTGWRWPWALGVAVLTLWPAWPILNGNPTVAADPLKYLLHHTGYAASVCLLAVLGLTPLKRLAGPRPWGAGLARQRRFLGVSSAVLALAHFGIHLLYEGGIGVLASNVKKPFLVAGMVALSVLLVLGLTSTQGWMRRLGPRWKKLHRLVWVAVILVVYHQVDSRKLFPTEILWLYLPWLALQGARWLPRRPVSAT